LTLSINNTNLLNVTSASFTILQPHSPTLSGTYTLNINNTSVVIMGTSDIPIQTTTIDLVHAIAISTGFIDV
jgi:hypothetical protein